MASQAGTFNVQEFADAGAPLVGGRLYTYSYGTTTQKTAYTDAAGTIPHTYTADGAGGQYISLNSRGELPAPLYLTSGAYDLALKRADGSSVWTRRAEIAFTATDAASSITAAVGSDGTLSFRNRLHNGNFIVNQRLVTGTVTLAAGAYGHDRWKAGAGGCTYTFAAVGNTTVITITAGTLMQVVEDKNIEGGVYTLVNQGTAQARIAVSGATTSGAYAAASTAAPLASASATANQTMTVEFTTGTIDRVQLEPGTVATTFERRPVGIELVMCQRYFQTHAILANGDIACGQANTTAVAFFGVKFQVTMRTSPTIAQIAATARLGGEVLGAFAGIVTSAAGFTATVAPSTTFGVGNAVLIMQGSSPTQPVWTASADL